MKIKKTGKEHVGKEHMGHHEKTKYSNYRNR